MNLSVVGSQLIVPSSYALGWRISSPQLLNHHQNGTMIIDRPQRYQTVPFRHDDCYDLPRGALTLLRRQLFRQARPYQLEHVDQPNPITIEASKLGELSPAERLLANFLSGNTDGIIRLATRDDIGKLLNTIYKIFPGLGLTVSAHAQETIDRVHSSIGRHAPLLRRDVDPAEDDCVPVPMLEVGHFRENYGNFPHRPIVLYPCPQDIQIADNEFYLTMAGGSRHFAILCEGELLSKSDEQYLRIHFGFEEFNFDVEGKVPYEVRTIWQNLGYLRANCSEEDFQQAVLAYARSPENFSISEAGVHEGAHRGALLLVQDLQQALPFLNLLPNYRLLRHFPSYSYIRHPVQEILPGYAQRTTPHAVATLESLDIVDWKSFDVVIRADRGDGLPPIPRFYLPESTCDRRRLTVVDFWERGGEWSRIEQSRYEQYGRAGYWPVNRDREAYFADTILNSLLGD